MTSDEEDPVLEEWEIEGDGELGWIAAAGAPGVPWSGTWSKEYCPTVEMNIVEGTEAVKIVIEPDIVTEDEGAGTHEIVVYDHKEEAYGNFVWPIDDLTIEIEDPAPGTWDVLARPNGASVQSSWPLSATAYGESPEPPATLVESAC